MPHVKVAASGPVSFSSSTGSPPRPSTSFNPACAVFRPQPTGKHTIPPLIMSSSATHKKSAPGNTQSWRSNAAPATAHQQQASNFSPVVGQICCTLRAHKVSTSEPIHVHPDFVNSTAFAHPCLVVEAWRSSIVPRFLIVASIVFSMISVQSCSLSLSWWYVTC